MIARCCLLVAVLAVSCGTLSTVTAEDDPEIFISGRRLSKDTELVWAIKRSRLMAVPLWHAGFEEAPLSPNKAVAIANDYIRNQLAVQGANVFRIFLMPLRAESDDRWMYDIDYTTDGFLLSDDPRLGVKVAMDGKVIIPEKRPVTEHTK